VFRIDAELRPEAATDIRRHDTQATRLECHRGIERRMEVVRLLRRSPHGDAVIRPAAFREQAARLDGMRAAAMLPQLLAEDVRRLPECRFGVPERYLEGGDDIGIELAAHRRRARLE